MQQILTSTCANVTTGGRGVNALVLEAERLGRNINTQLLEHIEILIVSFTFMNFQFDPHILVLKLKTFFRACENLQYILGPNFAVY